MKKYCRFLTWSTGYVPNSIPPKFEDKYIKPIAMLGSDGVMPLDGRKKMSSLIMDCELACESKNIRKPIGYEIRIDHFPSEDTVIYRKILKDKPSKK